MARPLRPRQVNPMPFAARLSATIEETCQATGLGKTTIYEMINAGRIETFMEGARRLVLVDSVVRLINPAYIPAYIPNPALGGTVRAPTEGNADEQRLSKRPAVQLRPRTNA